MMLKTLIAALLAAAPLFAAEPAPIPDKLVVLTFDDATRSHLTVAAPLLKKYGFGATFFVCQFKDFPPEEHKRHFLEWPEIRQLHEMGFEIGNHMPHHEGVVGKTPTQLNALLEQFEKTCADNGIPKPVSFCYPGGVTSNQAVEVLKERGYLWGRATALRAYDPALDHPLLIPGQGPGDCRNPRVLERLGSLAKDGKILVLMLHGVPDTGHPQCSMDPEAFEILLRCLKENGYRCVAMRDLSSFIDAKKAMELPVCSSTR